MSLRSCHTPAALVLALAACTPTHAPAPDGSRVDEPAPDPAADPGPPPSFVPRQPMRGGERDAGRAPVSLTASDGTGLRLVTLKARGVVEEPLAFTELHLVFENPNDRTIEGRFEIEMPPDAAISRFAMLIDGKWQEGEVVERRAAQVAYEDFLHRKQDPALLENNAGNAFSARVFPIRPRERKELIVSYSQELRSSAEPYRLMLRGLPELDELDASVILREPAAAPSGLSTSLATTGGSQRVIELRRQKWTPDQDLEVLDERGYAMMGLRHENLAVVRVAAPGAVATAPIGRLVVLFDTSASRALGFAGQVKRLRELLQALPGAEHLPLQLFAFDQTVREVYSGKVGELDARVFASLIEGDAMGASDLEGALAGVAAALADGAGPARLVIFSDGIGTAGDTEINALQQAARGLAGRGIQRIDAVIDGGIQDAEVLRQICTADLPQHGVVLDARLSVAALVHKLGSDTLDDIKVSVPGAEWTWPDTLRGLQPGDEALVYADLPASAAMRVVLTGADRIEMTVPTTAVERPLLERAWVGARIGRLDSMRSALPTGDGDARLALQRQIVDLSTRYRVLSDFTALLVLETENDYRRFNIDRNALTDILTVDATGVGLLQRRSAAPVPTPTPDPIPQMARNFDPEMAARQAGILGMMQAESGHFLASPYGGAFAVGNDDADVWGGLTGTAVGEAYGVGGLGLVGTGRGGGGTGEGTIGLGNTGLIGHGGGGGSGSGYGRGAGAGFGGRGTRVPTVRQARAEVQGALDRDIIRRIVRAHINEVRYCYNQALARDPNARGRVAIQFRIDGKGKVPSAVVQETTMRDAGVGNCMAQAARRWTFPKPEGGGDVIVTYPFVLEADGTGPVNSEPMRSPVEDNTRAKLDPFTGETKAIHQLLAARNPAEALKRARAWRSRDPGDVLALLALGEVLEAAKQPAQAARAYGSIIDLFPARADLRRYAGARLERLGDDGIDLALDTFARAVEQRPDHPAGHRLHAYALARAGKHREAFDAMVAGLERDRIWNRFPGVDRIFREDLGILAAVRIAADPASAKEVRATLTRLGVPLADAPSLRFVLNWETDANDVDFHITDGNGNKAWYSQRRLASGGELFADITTGYGPECFAIDGQAAAYPYKLSAHYYSRGPMGYGMGKLEVVQHDGKGHLKFDERPFVIMQDDAFVQLGTVNGPLR